MALDPWGIINANLNPSKNVVSFCIKANIYGMEQHINFVRPMIGVCGVLMYLFEGDCSLPKERLFLVTSFPFTNHRSAYWVFLQRNVCLSFRHERAFACNASSSTLHPVEELSTGMLGPTGMAVIIVVICDPLSSPI